LLGNLNRENILSNKRPEIKFTDTGGRIEPQVIPPNSFINGDCMEFMRTCPPNYFGLAIVDPPYGINISEDLHKRGQSCAKNGYRAWEYKDWDKEPPAKEYFEQLFRVSKNQIIWGGNYFELPPTRCWLVWDKGQRDFSFADGELAWTSFDKSMRIFTYSRAALLQEDKIHPTQKPVALYRWILKKFAKAGDLILDTHVGSASSLIACVELGFDYVGFEIDKDYYTMAKSRLERATRKYELFEG